MKFGFVFHLVNWIGLTGLITILGLRSYFFSIRFSQPVGLIPQSSSTSFSTHASVICNFTTTQPIIINNTSKNNNHPIISRNSNISISFLVIYCTHIIASTGAKVKKYFTYHNKHKYLYDQVLIYTIYKKR